jgi:PAS domain S-box-containing protein
MIENKKRVLKSLIKKLHTGASPQQLKQEFSRVLKDTTPLEIAKIEQDLIAEGMPRDELRKLCDLHMTIFREQLQKQDLDVPPEHPIHILTEEHSVMVQLAGQLRTISKDLERSTEQKPAAAHLRGLEHIAEDFEDSEKHYLREENVLFPILEKHGVTEPPAIMWTEHNQIREEKKRLRPLLRTHKTLGFQDFRQQVTQIAEALNSILPSHFFKENRMLFPTALRVISGDEWKSIRAEFDNIGYCCFTPPELTAEPSVTEPPTAEVTAPTVAKGVLQFETGSLSTAEVEAVLDALPIDITWVDQEDAVKYFNKAEERLFVRSKAIIGRKVQLCHPQKSVHVVNKIVEAFKAGKKDVAEFWIQNDGRLVYIRYFAVRDHRGKYLGTLEVTQDITHIKQIEGEKRLLDWSA